MLIESDGKATVNPVHPRRFRMSERLLARRENQISGHQLVVTAEDERNLLEFSHDVASVTQLLQKELAEVVNGELEVVSRLLPEKLKLMNSIELRMPVVEPFLLTGFAQNLQLPKQLVEFKASADKNTAHLERMAQAVGKIVREIRRATERHGLDGLYGMTGQKLTNAGGQTQKVDNKF